MRLYIIGLPGSGKSTLAKSISATYHLTHIELDQFFFQSNGRTYQRVYFEDFQSDLLKSLKTTDNWIIEGAYPIAEVYDLSDKVICLQAPVHTCIYRQWKRYAADPLQRDKAKFGTLTNISLTCKTLSLSLNIWGVKVYKNQARISYSKFLEKPGIIKIRKIEEMRPLFAQR